MELQVTTKDLFRLLEWRHDGDGLESRRVGEKDYLLISSLIGIMERLERLQGAVLSLQRTT